MRKKLITAILALLLLVPTMCMVTACTARQTVNVPDERPAAVGFQVYLRGTPVSTNNRTLTVTYEPWSNTQWYDAVEIRQLYADGSSSYLAFNQVTIDGLPDVLVANKAGYNVTIAYQNFKSINFRLIVARKAITRPTLYGRDLVYNGDDQTDINYDYSDYYNGYFSVVVDAGYDDLWQTDAGTYHTKFVLDANFQWATPVDGQYTDDYILTWSIAPVDATPEIVDND